MVLDVSIPRFFSFPLPVAYSRHFRQTTVVPTPGVDWMSNSSISRRAPGSPMPIPREVE
jgi:hypothetical protein